MENFQSLYNRIKTWVACQYKTTIGKKGIPGQRRQDSRLKLFCSFFIRQRYGRIIPGIFYTFV